MDFLTLFGTVIVIALIISLGMMTLATMQSTQTENSTEYNATGKGVTALKSYSNFALPIMLIVIVIFIIAIVLHLGKIKSFPV